ncbi:IclR family transcriptional regulator [Pseudonocardia sp. MH-G8]|uniref:IclR family transcriptional regulator n=1 Tax=Pseudonocardia sp. MH-G8 TaxID=1854588 RepID=UPI0018E98C8F|nr:IclR family transcriptional regulator [Pseudonocardia sp. MH-G8]
MSPAAEPGMRVVRTALCVLEAVSELQPVGVSAIARATGVPKSSVQRCLVSLREAGWISSPPGGPQRWTLTGRALAVGLRGSAEHGLREAAHAVMQDLRDRTRETIHLIGFGAGHSPASDADPALVVIDRLDSPEPVRTWVRLGTRVPLHASCSGRAVLSRLPEAEARALVGDGLERFSDQTITDHDALADELRAVRERGYAIADQSWRSGVGAVAAAVVDAAGRPVGALAVSAPQQRFDAERAVDLGAAAVAAAARVSAAL